MMGPEVLWHDGCVRCGCAATWHRLPSGMDPTSADAVFPCLGFEYRGCRLECPDFVHDNGQLAFTGGNNG